jgi:hypothetical protein
VDRTAWLGKAVALLTASDDRDTTVMRQLLQVFDSTDAYYARLTGRRPAPGRSILGRTPIVEVPVTCGAGCGLLGAAGIEIQSDYFAALYERVRTHGEFDQIPFYEFGRNYWFWTPQLAYKSPDDTGVIPTGYAVFMRFLSMEATRVRGAPFRGTIPFVEFRFEVEGLLDRYLADTTLRWENTLRIGRAPDNPMGLGGTDLFASMLLRLRRDYGGDRFVTRLWREVSHRPAAATTAEAVNNFRAAASAAAGQDLTPLFRAWRWPEAD